MKRRMTMIRFELDTDYLDSYPIRMINEGQNSYIKEAPRSYIEALEIGIEFLTNLKDHVIKDSNKEPGIT
jgi:hypothetical protein